MHEKGLTMYKSFKLMNFEVKVILLGILLTSISTFMLSPFLTLYMNHKGFEISQIAIILTINLICQQGMTFFGGLLGDKFGYRSTLIFGLILRIIGYLIYAFMSKIYFFMLAGALVGLGGALITPSTKAAISTAEKSLLAEAFALRNIAVNIGAAIGPVIGGLFFKTSFIIVFLITAFTNIILLMAILIFIKKFDNNCRNNNIIKDFKTIVLDTNIVKFTLVVSLFWILYSQLILIIPLYAKDFLNNTSITGTLFTLNGIIVIGLQFYMIKWFNSKYMYKDILFCGMLLISASFIGLIFFRNTFGMYIFIIFFTLGEILVGPSIDNFTSDLALSKSNLGGYLGFVSLGWGLGGIIGNLLGSKLYNYIQPKSEYSKLWLIYIFIAISAAILFKKLKYNIKRK